MVKRGRKPSEETPAPAQAAAAVAATAPAAAATATATATTTAIAKDDKEEFQLGNRRIVMSRKVFERHYRQSGQRKEKCAYTKEEEETLEAGVAEFGKDMAGRYQWSKILEKGGFQPGRTTVDLKDKWRSMQRKKGLVPKQASKALKDGTRKPPAKRAKRGKGVPSFEEEEQPTTVRIVLAMGDAKNAKTKNLKPMDPKAHKVSDIISMLETNRHVLPPTLRNQDILLVDDKGRQLANGMTLYKNGFTQGDVRLIVKGNTRVEQV